MGRPSIFSREYKRKMRARRMKNIFLTLIVIIAAGAFLLRDNVRTWLNHKVNTVYVSKNNVIGLVTNKVRNVLSEHKTEENRDFGKDKDNQEKTMERETDSKKNTAEGNSLPVEQSYQMNLNSGKVVNVIYEQIGDKKRFKGASGENDIYFNISPSGTSIVILDQSSQDMFFMNEAGTVEDITKKQYVSTSGVDVYNKDEQIAKTPEYIWHGTPKFIDEDNVVYISNLPWFNKKGERFIWKVNLKTKEHINILGTGAASLSFDKLTEKGLAVNIEGKVKYLQQGGQLIE